MRALTFFIDLAEPLLATQPHSGEANSAISYSFVPGSMLRGALVRAYQTGAPGDLLMDDWAQRLFFNGDVRYLNAYLAHPNEPAPTRLLPTPLSWRMEKEKRGQKGAPIYDWAFPQPKLGKPTPPKGQFCWLDDTDAYLADHASQVNVHNASQNRDRKSASESQVYRYEALAAGTRLVGVVAAEDKGALDKVKELLEGRTFILGGSHTGGYGRVEISTVTRLDNWHEYTADGEPDEFVVVTLLSDAIVQTPDGLPTLDLPTALGLTGEQRSDGRIRVYQDARLVGGFNRKWGLPLPQAWAIQAGSAAYLPLGLVHPQRLARLVETGVGERRVEGFGRIAVNWHAQTRYTRQEFEPVSKRATVALSATSQTLAGRMANRWLRVDLDNKLLELVMRADRELTGKLPPATQLARVRVVARQTLLTGDKDVAELKDIADYLDRLKGAKEDWRDARIRHEPLLKWIKARAQLTEEGFRTEFGVTQMPKMAGVGSSLTPELQREYKARLIDGVLKLAVERVKRERQGGSHG